MSENGMDCISVDGFRFLSASCCNTTPQRGWAREWPASTTSNRTPSLPKWTGPSRCRPHIPFQRCMLGKLAIDHTPGGQNRHKKKKSIRILDSCPIAKQQCYLLMYRLQSILDASLMIHFNLVRLALVLSLWTMIMILGHTCELTFIVLRSETFLSMQPCPKRNKMMPLLKYFYFYFF